MTIEVDQSIKIEQSGATVLACANSVTHAILIPQRVKRAGLATLLAKGKSRDVAPLLLFAAGLYLLLHGKFARLRKIIIDVEYEGKDADIRGFLLRYIRRTMPDFSAETIVFQRVGKHSPADQKARAVREGKDRAYRKITLAEFLQVIT